jgi:Uncharacterised nucleotidyltransferase
MQVPALRLILLELLGPGTPPELARLTETDWALLDSMAAQHRLQARLHALHADAASIPTAVRKRWSDAYRRSALMALVQQAELRECVAILGQAGIVPVALKGAWLSREVYAHPAERPLRDIDLLIRRDQALEAFAVLQRAGYVMDYPPPEPLEEILKHFRHLPGLIAPRGTLVELHHWLWEPLTGPAARRGAPAADPGASMHERAQAKQGIHFPVAADLLDHLIIHALYSHRLDCGPLVLSDLALLADRSTIDWSAFWARADDGGWSAGAALLFALSRRYHGPSALPESARDSLRPNDKVMMAAAMLLLPEPSSTGSSHGFGEALGKGIGGLRERYRTLSTPYPGSFARWLASRAIQHAPQLISRKFRRQAHDQALLTNWLEQ